MDGVSRGDVFMCLYIYRGPRTLPREFVLARSIGGSHMSICILLFAFQ